MIFRASVGERQVKFPPVADRFNNGQTQAGTGHIGAEPTVEGFQNAGTVFFRNAGALIHDAEHRRLDLSQLDRDGAAFGRVAYGVLQKITQNREEVVGLHGKRWISIGRQVFKPFDFNRDAQTLSFPIDGFDGFANGLRNGSMGRSGICRFGIGRSRAGLRPLQSEQLAYLSHSAINTGAQCLHFFACFC